METMLTKFEINEATQLKQQIEQSTQFFVFNPDISNQIKRLNELQEKCEHCFDKGVCIYCGKETK